ncbi:trypsin-like peptidase domain-containing protein [Marivirga salinae]|uniref:Trypsin-like peptidase domain-containing protein n=1 Tax=Marivirga salinarum TaxID=3059078 RepID=A0AA49J8D1_9BACT|nr:trypsin-like peptidase domain-containing protein [Marivirga sp. BDSF4-3]WKK73611.2 trypsin-like peptidase domain-containing protein [Marivirga sp. BDSF4-3]
MRIKAIAILFIAIIFSSSCASILNPKYQKIEIQKEKGSKVLVNGEDPKLKKGQVALERNKKPKQITIIKEGKKDANFVVNSYKKSPLYILSWIPFGIYGTFLLDNYPRSYNYDKILTVGKLESALILKPEGAKDIKINTVSLNIKPEDYKYRSINGYKSFKKKPNKVELEPFDTDEEIKIEESIFSHSLNELLKNNGYIDTTRNVLKNSFSNNLYINANVNKVSIHEIFTGYKNSVYNKGSFYYVDLNIEWEILDIYKETIYTQTTEVTSGEFAALGKSDSKEIDALRLAVDDGVELGLIKFINSEKVQEALMDKSFEEESNSFEELSIKNNNNYVSNLNEAVQSSVTIKHDKSHGSGFVIGSDGYILTNYHVINTANENSRVVFNDKSEYEFEVVRSSKLYDLALVKVEKTNLMPFKMNMDKNIPIATDIYAVGTPTAQDLSQTVSKGIISGLRDYVNGSKLIQTDASINGGNSGGALATKNGLVFGVVSAKLKGIGIEGVAFGIPAYEVTDKLKLNIN